MGASDLLRGVVGVLGPARINKGPAGVIGCAANEHT